MFLAVLFNIAFVVREICDKIITAYGKWPTIIEKLKCPDGYREQ